MKNLIVLCDGMADRPLELFGGKTPLEAAAKPNMDALAGAGRVGRMATLYPDLPTGSDVANLSVLGFDPHLYYTGRSPIEALGLGVPLDHGDVVCRLNLVTLSGEPEFEKKRILDHSAGKIPTPEAAELIKALCDEFSSERVKIYPGMSYRHVFVLKGGGDLGELVPPHDVLGRPVAENLPSGPMAAELISMMKKSVEILEAHPVNLARRERGEAAANCLWLWGQGGRPAFPKFAEVYGVERGMMITAVPLLKGLAAGIGLEYPEIPGATGEYHTNYAGKAGAAVEAFERGFEFVFVHIEAPDECGHDGDAPLKKAAIERIDEEILGPVYRALSDMGGRFKILVTPDHATPVALRTHSAEPVPFILYDSAHVCDGGTGYGEREAEGSELFYPDGYRLMADFLAE